jgi:GNAT superfamily N-acetyltransferase
MMLHQTESSCDRWVLLTYGLVQLAESSHIITEDMSQVTLHKSVSSLEGREGMVAAEHMASALSKVLATADCVTRTDRYVRVVSGEPHPLGNFILGLSPTDLDGLVEGLKGLEEVLVPSALIYTKRVTDEEVLSQIMASGHDLIDQIPAMACDICDVPATSLPEGYEVIEVDGGDHEEDWVECLANGYGLPIGVARLFPPKATDEARFFGVTHNGRIVSVSAVLLSDGVAGVYCVATLEEERRKGLGAHLTAHALRVAAESGYTVGVLQATEMGKPIYERLGFKHCGDVTMYIRLPKAES